jgi:DNA-binding winged helix-turn-helix (wHTH) protein
VFTIADGLRESPRTIVPGRYAQLAGCVLDSQTHVLFRAGEPAHLTPKAVELLTILARAAPAAVTKEELMGQLWPDTFVCEANIPNLVAEIRVELRDTARPPRCLRTVHRVGYALCCEVRWVDEPEAGGLERRLAGCYVVVDGHERQLAFGENIIGRGDGCHVFVPSSTVSRQHAAITVSAESAEIRDLRSRNGTFLNGRRLKKARALADGDGIRVGGVSLRYHACDRSKETRPDA